jgi:hypothetical protein
VTPRLFLRAAAKAAAVLDDIRRAHLLHFPYAVYSFLDEERI